MTFKVTNYPPGAFTWADAVSTDQAKSRTFYAGLMGWQPDEVPMGDGMTYTMFKQDGENICGLGPMMADQQAQGTPSYWNNYVAVDDVDSIVSKITAAGGTVIMPPMDVFDSGRMLVIQDPTGAMLGLWQARNHHGSGLVNIPGAVTWNELTTPNPQQAMDFYRQVFGWSYEKMDGVEYYTVSNKGRPNGGIMPPAEGMEAMPPNWAVYFSIENIDETVTRAAQLGGKVLTPVMDAGGIGRFAFIADPTGAVAGFIQNDQPLPWSD